MLRDTTGPLGEDDGLAPIFEHTARLGVKDLEHALELAQSNGVALPLADLAVTKLPAALGVTNPPTT